MELKVINAGGGYVPISVDDAIFACEYNEPLVHQIIVAYQANARSGNRKQKDRQEVRHSTKKPFKQKGTGRARAGMSSSPLWRGGGRIFPSTPSENFTQKVNRKMYRLGLATIFSQLNREDRLIVVDDFLISEPKTRFVFQKLKLMGVSSALILTDILDDVLTLAARNLQKVSVFRVNQVDPVSLISFPKVVLTKAALVKIEGMLK